jgi:hypothetical protein
VGIMNRRNAMLGWVVWEVAKRVLKRKAKAAVPGTVDDSLRPNKSAIVLLALLAAAAAVLARHLFEEDDFELPE